MCQKAFGNYMAPFAGVRLAELSWTRGTLATFRSSEEVERGFCRDCGTPLTYRVLGKDRISVSIGSLDEPARVTPVVQYGIEGLLPAFDTLHRLPAEETSRDRFSSSHQHPDRD